MKLPIFLWLLLAASLSAQVQVDSLPEPGIQPQVALTAEGVGHPVYLKSDPKACGIRHSVRRSGGGGWAAPVMANSTPDSAIATGTIRGAQIALGKGGSVQVIWNGSAGAKPGGAAQAPLLYARLGPGATAFSIQQNLLGDTTALDGGASIPANGQGRVAVVWHAAPPRKDDESTRLVRVRYSDNDRATFPAPKPLHASQPGVCACCSLRAHLAGDGTLCVLYRAATAPTERGMWLITGKTGQTTLKKLDDCRVAKCPMSSASHMTSGPTLCGTLENEGQMVTGIIAETSASRKIGPKHAKHPVLARNSKGQTLVASIRGSGWSRTGTLHWEILDAQGNIPESGEGDRLPVWSYAATYAQPDGGFFLLHWCSISEIP